MVKGASAVGKQSPLPRRAREKKHPVRRICVEVFASCGEFQKYTMRQFTSLQCTQSMRTCVLDLLNFLLLGIRDHPMGGGTGPPRRGGYGPPNTGPSRRGGSTGPMNHDALQLSAGDGSLP